MNFMKDYTNIINYPLYDISEESWNRNRNKEHNFLFENPYIGIPPINKEVFKAQIKEFKYIDAEGSIIYVTDYKTHNRKGLAQLFFFIKRIELVLVKSNESYSFEDFKNLLSQRAKQTNNSLLQQNLANAKGFKDILTKM